MGKRLNTLYAESVSEDLNSPTHSTFLNDWCFRIWLKGPVLVVWKKKSSRFMSLRGTFPAALFFSTTKLPKSMNFCFMILP